MLKIMQTANIFNFIFMTRGWIFLVKAYKNKSALFLKKYIQIFHETGC